MTDIEKQSDIQERARQLAEQYQNIANEIPFLQPLRYASETSKVSKKGIVPAGEYYFGQDRPLGGAVLATVLEHRLHAIKIVQSKKVLESYNVEYSTINGKREITGDVDFVTIKNGADDIKKGITHLWGPELLVYLPEIGEFAIFFLSKTSSRKRWNEFLDPNLFPGKPCIFTTQLVAPETLSYSWYEPHCRRATDDECVNFTLPLEARLDSALKKWNDAPNKVGQDEGEAVDVDR